ncbi:hypothetical protein M9458_043213, partial [Cirrhinus mrigala]
PCLYHDAENSTEVLARQQVPLPVFTCAGGHCCVGTKTYFVIICSLALHAENSIPMHCGIFPAVRRGLEMSIHDVVNHNTRPVSQEQRQPLTAFAVPTGALHIEVN